MSAAPYAAREVHETATKNGGELTSAEIGAGAVVAGGLHPLPHAPAGRKVAVSDPPDYIGVYIATRYQAVTKIFGKSYNLSEQTVYRMEAQTR